MRMLGTLAILASAAIAGCGSSASTDANNSGDKGACTLTLTGAVSGTSSCIVGAFYGTIATGRSDFSIVSNTAPHTTLDFSKEGTLASGTITDTSPGVDEAGGTVENAAGLLWTAQTQEPVHGSISVNLTSVSLGSDGRTYTAHGTADGTLTPDQSSAGATGTVTVHAVF